MVIRKRKKVRIDKLLADLNRAKGINGVRFLIRKYFSAGFRRALVGKAPEFFLLYYLAFRLPAHQRRWIQMWKIKYLVELAPRDHGKSWIFSYGLPLYEIYVSLVRSNLISTDARVLQISKTDEQAGKFATQVRETIEKNRYLREDFGDIRDLRHWVKGYFRCKRDPNADVEEKDYTYEKVGVLGSITGGHYHRVVIDDPLDDENTKTGDRMDAIENWFWGTIWNTRETYTSFVVVGTRKNRRDLYNTLLQSPLWKSNTEKAVIKYPVIPDPDKPGMTKQGWLYITDKKNLISHPSQLKIGETIMDIELLTDDYEVLWPPEDSVDNDGNVEVDPNTGKAKIFGWGIKELLLDRAAQGGIYFDREKQNSISSEEGAIFKKEWFKYFDNEELYFNETDGHVYLVPK